MCSKRRLVTHRSTIELPRSWPLPLQIFVYLGTTRIVEEDGSFGWVSPISSGSRGPPILLFDLLNKCAPAAYRCSAGRPLNRNRSAGPLRSDRDACFAKGVK